MVCIAIFTAKLLMFKFALFLDEENNQRGLTLFQISRYAISSPSLASMKTRNVDQIMVTSVFVHLSYGGSL
jgi:hypothetical protein